MIMKIDNEIELKPLERSDSVDIFEAIDSQREYLGKWLPFVEYTRKISDTEKYVNSVVNAPEDRFEYVFTIRKQDDFLGLIDIDYDKPVKNVADSILVAEKPHSPLPP